MLRRGTADCADSADAWTEVSVVLTAKSAKSEKAPRAQRGAGDCRSELGVHGGGDNETIGHETRGLGGLATELRRTRCAVGM